MSRYHGFTCPECGSHMFGTYTYQPSMGRKYPAGTRVGMCHENQHSGNGCRFEWDRSDPESESAVMYVQTLQEWMAAFDKNAEAEQRCL